MGAEEGVVGGELGRAGLTVRRWVGDGSYGRVAMCERIGGGAPVAVKVLDHRRMSQRNLRQFLPRELRIHAALRHPHVVRLYRHWEGPPAHTYIILELAEKGDLEQYISREGRLPDTHQAGDLPRRLFHQILLAVQYIHDCGIAHRDIKCENVFLTAAMDVKLGDLGFAREQAGEEMSLTWCGSRAYAAPEVARQLPYVGHAADCWSLGVVLFIMLEARFPFDNRISARLLLRNQDEQRIPFSHCDVDARRFVRAFLHPNTHLRISAAAALLHSWFHPDAPSQSDDDYLP